MEGMLEEIRDDVKELRKDFTKLLVSHAKLQTEFKFKSGIWGLIGGIIPTIGLILIYFLRKL